MTKEHWNKVYKNKPVEQLGWYETQSVPSIQLIERCAVSKHAPIADIGSGASVLISELLSRGYENLFAIDISGEALEKAKARLCSKQAERAHWIVGDMTHPSTARQLPDIAIWHDRAMFHFLVEEAQRQAYHALLQEKVIPGGFVILATFALHGADMCSGLPVQRYSAESLSVFLGAGFQLIESVDYTYTMPSGAKRPYVYTRFQCKGLRQG